MSTSCEAISEELCGQVSGSFMLKQLNIFAGGKQRLVGSSRTQKLAELIVEDWKRWGIPRVHLTEFFVTLPPGPDPGDSWNSVQLTDWIGNKSLHEAKNFVTIKLSENEQEKAPVFQAYSKSGIAFGPIVYVNYARPQDLIEFDQAQGRLPHQPSLLCDPNLIVLARTDVSGRQSKIRALTNHCSCGPQGQSIQGHHVAAVILFPDPCDYAPNADDIYPDGPGLPGDAPIFGHVCMTNVGGGNPNTPGLPSSAHIYEENRMAPGRALTSMLIQPIGYEDAGVILNAIGGTPIPESWKPSLARSIGPSQDCKLRVAVRNRVAERPVRCSNVLGVVPGSEEPDQYVMLGNHRDAWLQGAFDPGSGNSMLQQIAKILGNAYRRGFRPRRSLVLASWDGEEFSLLGSTHAAMQSREQWLRRAVLYINADCPVKGRKRFEARMSDALLRDAVFQSAKKVRVDPLVDERTLYDFWRAGKPEPDCSPLGGGSDHVPFAYKLAVPCIYPQFAPDDVRGIVPVYHTAYDTVDYLTRFIDPPNAECVTQHPESTVQAECLPRHRLLCRLLLTLLVQFACADRLPFAPLSLARQLSAQWTEFVQLVQHAMPAIQQLGIRLDWITDDLRQFQEAAGNLERFCDEHCNKPEKFPSWINRLLAGIPSQFRLSKLGKGRAFSNCLVGAKGYQCVTFPCVRQSFARLLKCRSDRKDISPELCDFKADLSALTACINQATDWLGNGLLGLRLLG